VNAQKELTKVLDESYPWCADWEPELRELFRNFVLRKQKSQALDYDDLLLYWNHLVADVEFATEIGSWFDHVLVDEYQDTNLVQAQILRSLKPGGNGMTVVGDDAQSIYSFRAAEVENILGFPDQFMPKSEVVILERNYRSTQEILNVANCLIAESDRQYRKDLFTDKKNGAKPHYVTVEDGDAEAEYVVETILRNREMGMRLMDQAVLFRGAHHSDRLELELLRRNIPYVKYGGLKFLEAAHVKDMLSILRWAENPKNEVAAFRVLKLLPGMGPGNASRCHEQMQRDDYLFSTLRHFRAPAAAAKDWDEFCDLMESLSAYEADDAGWQAQLSQVRRWYQPHLERLYDGLETREADLEQLEQISGRYATRERFLTELTLDPPSAAGDLAGDPLLDEDYLVLSTVHSAKGQEWEAVFILNVADGNFPSEFATGKPAMIEEERRLLYVAMTRAKQSLSLMAPLKYHVTQQRRDGDKHVYGARSRFLTEALLQTMQPCFHGRTEHGAQRQQITSSKRLDVAGHMREMW
jgi:DNA helicase-2/ATP-dependent DNA helicase PcrA